MNIAGDLAAGFLFMFADLAGLVSAALGLVSKMFSQTECMLATLDSQC